MVLCGKRQDLTPRFHTRPDPEVSQLCGKRQDLTPRFVRDEVTDEVIAK